MLSSRARSWPVGVGDLAAWRAGLRAQDNRPAHTTVVVAATASRLISLLVDRPSRSVRPTRPLFPIIARGGGADSARTRRLERAGGASSSPNRRRPRARDISTGHGRARRAGRHQGALLCFVPFAGRPLIGSEAAAGQSAARKGLRAVGPAPSRLAVVDLVRFSVATVAPAQLDKLPLPDKGSIRRR
jgi:hypothetical protein